MKSLLLPVVLVAGLTGGCAAGTDGTAGTGGTSASCADLVRYDGHRYVGHGELTRTPAVDGPAGTATRLPCDDGNGAAPASEMQVQRLRDLPPERAFLSHGQLYVRDARDLPEAARAWFAPVRCTGDDDFELTGRWLGVESPREARFDGDLRPPYRITAWVSAGPTRYVDVQVVVHATAATDPALGPEDVKRSLWQGGEVTAQVHCEDGRFVADALSTPR